MTSLAPGAAADRQIASAWRIMAAVAVGLTLLRLIGAAASPVNLHFDEAQYWAWSRSFEWGYYSKPPLVAWVIGLSTGLFGNAEWAVRLAAPLAHGGAGLVLFALGRRLYGDAAGLWAGIGWLLLPGVWLSSAVMSTDALLLPLWACALYALFRVIEGGGWRWALALGAAVGLGALAKYAMLYFFLCAPLACLWAPEARRALFSREGLMAGGAALAILAPNLLWNAANEFATIGHTADNARLDGPLFNPGEMLEFLGSQAGVIGPVLFVALGACFWRAARAPAALGQTERVLLAFILPPLVIILSQALLSRAHANWAAAAYPAALVLLAGRFAQSAGGRRLLGLGYGVNALAGLVFFTFAVAPSIADAAGAADAFKRARGWEDVCAATQARTAAAQPAYSAVLVDHRALFFALSYYCRPEAVAAPLPPLRMWILRAEPENHAAATAPMTAADGQNVLIVHMTEGYVPFIRGDFAAAGALQAVQIDLGGGERRWIGFSQAAGFAPVPRDDAFLARIDAPAR